MKTQFPGLRVIKTGLEEKVEVEFRRYQNGNLFAMMYLKGRPWANISTNLKDVKLEPDEMLVPAHNLSVKIMRTLLESGDFIDTGKAIPSGFVVLPIWKVANLDTKAVL